MAAESSHGTSTKTSAQAVTTTNFDAIVATSDQTPTNDDGRTAGNVKPRGG